VNRRAAAAAHRGAAAGKTEDIVDMSLCKKFDETGFMDRL
jgi:hypothetical protein